MSAAAAVRRIGDADLSWNFSCAVREPLLGRFRRRALIDGDPGEIQISALTSDLGIDGHDVFFTAGLNIGSPDGRTPTLGREWIPFRQFVHLSLWPISVPPPGAPFTSITQWSWWELWWNDEVLETGKRAAYLHVLDLPRRTSEPIEPGSRACSDDLPAFGGPINAICAAPSGRITSAGPPCIPPFLGRSSSSASSEPPRPCSRA